MLNLSHLRQRAGERLDFAAYSPSRLVLIHTAISLGASLVVALFNLLIASMIDDTGGLSGLGMRSILETAQASLELAVTVALPFWNISLTRAALCWARGELAEPPTLLEGFRRWRPVLGLKLITALLFLGICIAVSYLGVALFMLTPFADPLMKILEPMMQQSSIMDPNLQLTDEMIGQIGSAAVPLLVFVGVLMAIVAIPLWYRIRLADFAVMDGCHGRIAMRESARITQKNCLQILKIDLSYWWFYLLQGLTVALCYGDTILPALGVALPISEELAYFGFLALGLVCQGLLLWKFQAQVSLTYALAYETLSAESEWKMTNAEPINP